MKFRFNVRKAVAFTGIAGIAVAGVLVAPSAQAARSTVTVIESNTFTSLNTGNPDDNIVINGDVAYLTSMGLWHYDDAVKIVANPILGSYKVTKNVPGDYEVTYTVAPGRLWSDGTAITAADFLLSYVVSSSKYSKDAGLGDPSNPDAPTAFISGGYGGVFDQHVAGIPTISSDGMAITVKYDNPIPDWIINGFQTPFPVHTLELLADGKTALGTAAENTAAKAKFVADVNGKKTDALKKMGGIWSTGYEATKIDASTNPLLLVNNGPYLVASVDDSQIKLTANPKYNSGPALSGITTVVIKQGIKDGSPSAQALANGDTDVYQGQPTADAVAQLSAISTAKVVKSSSLAYEHIELRVGASGGGAAYKGPFAGMSQKAVDLRKAFLLAYPRADIVAKLIQPIDPNAKVLGSVWALPGTPYATELAAKNGMAFYNTGTQADRTAAALALVKKYYPKAGNGSTPININLLWGSPGNARREAEAALIIAEEAKAGFKVTAPATKGWGGKLNDSAYDAHFFIFDQTAAPQDAQNCPIFQTGGGSNYTGYSNKKVDDLCTKLNAKPQYPNTVFLFKGSIEKQIANDAFFLGIFQNPEVTAYNKALIGVKPAPLSPSLFWNFWEWHF